MVKDHVSTACVAIEKSDDRVLIYSTSASTQSIDHTVRDYAPRKQSKLMRIMLLDEAVLRLGYPRMLTGRLAWREEQVMNRSLDAGVSTTDYWRRGQHSLKIQLLCLIRPVLTNYDSSDFSRDFPCQPQTILLVSCQLTTFIYVPSHPLKQVAHKQACRSVVLVSLSRPVRSLTASNVDARHSCGLPCTFAIVRSNL